MRNECNLTSCSLIRMVSCYDHLTICCSLALLLASLDASTGFVSSSEGLQTIRNTIELSNELRETIRRSDNTSKINDIVSCTRLVYMSYHIACRLLDDSAAIRRHGLMIDPLRLCVRFENISALTIDDAMCEG